MEENVIIYPTTPDADGWFYEDEGEAAFEILTKEYENGNLVKKFTLKKGKHKGKEISVRELKAKDTEAINKMLKDEKGEERQNKYMQYTMFKASNLAEIGIMPEDIPEMHASDYTKLSVANATLNFM